jgi:hypothetical protein
MSYEIENGLSEGTTRTRTNRLYSLPETQLESIVAIETKKTIHPARNSSKKTQSGGNFLETENRMSLWNTGTIHVWSLPKI